MCGEGQKGREEEREGDTGDGRRRRHQGGKGAPWWERERGRRDEGTLGGVEEEGQKHQEEGEREDALQWLTEVFWPKAHHSMVSVRSTSLQWKRCWRVWGVANETSTLAFVRMFHGTL